MRKSLDFFETNIFRIFLYLLLCEAKFIIKNSGLTESIFGSGLTTFSTKFIILIKFFFQNLKKFNPKVLSNFK